MNKKKKLGLNERMKRYVHYEWGVHKKDSKWHKKGDLNYLKSTMFDITVRYPNGTREKEIEKLRNFVINCPWIDYYSIGIEGDDDHENTHLHIRIVVHEMMKVADIKEKFAEVRDDDRCVVVNHENISFFVDSVSRNEMPNKTPMLQLAYPLKNAAYGKRVQDIKPECYNNGVTTWTNLFDGERDAPETDKEKWAWYREMFASMLFAEEKKKKNKTLYQINSGNAIEQAQTYAKNNNIVWSKETHVNILATMCTDKLGEKRFALSSTFMGKTILEDLNEHKDDENYKSQVEDALNLKFTLNRIKMAKLRAKAAAGGAAVSTTAKNATIEALKKENKALTRENVSLKKMYVKLENICKGHVLDKQNQKRKEKGLPPLEDPTKTSTYFIHTDGSAERCSVCSGTQTNAYWQKKGLIKISPCKHLYCYSCIEPQLDNNTIDCSHCNIDAINKGTRLKETWCKGFAEDAARARQQEASKKRPLDTISVEDQERIKRLKAIEARSQKK